MEVFSETTVEARIPVIVEQGLTGWSAFVPSAPGVIATGLSREQVLRRMRKALTLHFEDLHEQQAPTDLAEARRAVIGARKEREALRSSS